MRITVTAFEPFGGFNTNSSFTAISQLDDSIDKLILPVSYPDAYIYLKEHLKESDLIILLGMAASRKTISLEERARNILEFKIPDNSGKVLSNIPIDDTKDEYLYSQINIDKLINELNSDIVTKSNDAGTFICNYLYFSVLKDYQIPSIFIHIPNYQTEDEFKTLNNILNKIINHLKGEL